MDVRGRLRQALDIRGLSPRALSLRAEMSDSAAHKFLTQANQSITLDTLNKFAAVLEMPGEWLAYGVGGDGDSLGGNNHLTSEEVGWVQLLASLEPKDRAALLQLARSLAGTAPSRAIHERAAEYRAG